MAEMFILGITTALTSHRAKIKQTNKQKNSKKKKKLPEEDLEQTEA